MTTSGNRHILAVIDQYSSYPYLLPLPDMKAETIVSKLHVL